MKPNFPSRAVLIEIGCYLSQLYYEFILLIPSKHSVRAEYKQTPATNQRPFVYAISIRSTVVAEARWVLLA
jgi:hypothetical protein